VKKIQSLKIFLNSLVWLARQMNIPVSRISYAGMLANIV